MELNDFAGRTKFPREPYAGRRLESLVLDPYLVEANSDTKACRYLDLMIIVFYSLQETVLAEGIRKRTSEGHATIIKRVKSPHVQDLNVTTHRVFKQNRMIYRVLNAFCRL